MKELTFCSTYHNDSEVMVNVDSTTMEVIGIYTYKDCVPDELYLDGEEEFKMKWTKGKNPLFVHCSIDLEDGFEALIKNGYICIGNETEDEEVFVSDLLMKYDLGAYIENY